MIISLVVSGLLLFSSLPTPSFVDICFLFPPYENLDIYDHFLIYELNKITHDIKHIQKALYFLFLLYKIDNI